MTAQFDCPRCGSMLTMSERQGVEIDYCPSCRGVWLDRGELDKILDRVAAEAPSSPPPAAGGWAQPGPAPGAPAAGGGYQPPPYPAQPPGWDQRQGGRRDDDDDDDRYRQHGGRRRGHWLSNLFD